ncbi:hypothetical protein BKA70DRAFT_1535515 [Coprinopsis sp. MPI-PUGE-AT-0042]|nr:hypothetical protein BKA70DRAFT_1535515 [Coprinopsis sp. MPI-PUGE-AT-0042]
MCTECGFAAPPTAHASASPTFQRPPLDGSLNLVEIYEWHATHNREHLVFVYPGADGVVQNLNWGHVARMVEHEALRIRHLLCPLVDSAASAVVAVIANCDTITYFTMLMGIARAGFTSFPMSHRNSAPAIAHLCRVSNVKHIIHSAEPSLSTLIGDAMDALRNDPTSIIPTLSQIPPLRSGLSDVSPVPISPYIKQPMDSVQIYVHSSGSTGLPKPIPWTFKQILQLGYTCYFGERNLTGKILAIHAIPAFHGLGMMQMGWTAMSGIVLSVFEPATPAIFPTPENHFEAMAITQSDLVLAVPSMIEPWSRDPSKVRYLQGMIGVVYGGGPLNREVGDFLVRERVSLHPLYGTCECGTVNPIIPGKCLSQSLPIYLNGNTAYKMVDAGDGLFEFVMLTNPSPMEAMLNQDDRIHAAVVFGCGHPRAGAIIEPADPLCATSEEGIVQFVDAIWPSFEKLNSIVPQHSRILREMISISDPSKPFKYTAKGTPRRQAILQDYEEEIARLYGHSSPVIKCGIPLPECWNPQSALSFVGSVIRKTLSPRIQDNDDIFDHGCDSFTATCIRHSLLRVFPGVSGGEATRNFVYECRTISSIARFLVDTRASAQLSGESLLSTKTTEMRALVARFACKTSRQSSTEVLDTPERRPGVILTGTTGVLGSHILLELVKDARVGVIYALNRPSRDGKESLRDRQTASLEAIGEDGRSLINARKLILVEADLSLPGFGIEGALFQEMKRTVTHIYHNAWPVHFGLTLQSYTQSFSDLRCLIDFALTCEQVPQFIFTSTIAVCRGALGHTAQVKEQPVEPEIAVGLGYTEAKWVSESILLQALRTTGLRTVIVRVGQLTGSGESGWKTSEWFPQMVRGSTLMGGLPKVTTTISWLPIKAAAQVMAKFVEHEATTESGIVHLVHPNPIPWSVLNNALSSILNLPTIPFDEWVERLEKVEQNSVHNPTPGGLPVAIAQVCFLLPFFKHARSLWREQTESQGEPIYEMSKAQRLSPLLHDGRIPQLSHADVEMWVNGWKKIGFLAS